MGEICMKSNRLEGLSHVLWLGASTAAFLLGMTGLAFATVPEMDPGTASSGLALVAGAVFLLREAYRRRS
jgi:hypothetical protein